MATPKRLWIYGTHAIQAVVQEAPHRLIRCFIAQKSEPRGIDEKKLALIGAMEAQGIKAIPIRSEKLDALLGNRSHQGMAVEVLPPRQHTLESLMQQVQQKDEPPFFLVLDQVVDPRNLGACFRSAYAAGAHGIISSWARSACITPIVQKVACGATEKIAWVVSKHLTESLDQLRDHGILTLGLDPKGSCPIYTAHKPTDGVAWVLGSEAEGMRAKTRKHCDLLCQIPMSETDFSINVSAAAAIACFETRRQRSIF